jgi:GAF domain-containing protein
MDSDQNKSEETLAKQLRRLLVAIEASGRAVLPGSNDALLNSIVEAAARIFGAAAASILLVNEEEQVLEFKVAFGPSERDLVGTKFPLDRGIAGYVVMTGQPIATSNVTQDARFDQEFAKSTGYVPNSILATPLLSEDRIIGVMEVLDKIDAASFGIHDMELLGMFANQAAMAIDLSQQMENIEEALARGLRKLIAAENLSGSDELVSVL